MSEPPFADARILIVDDELANVHLLEMLLAGAGCSQLKSTLDPRQVVSLYESFRPDIILLDLSMPHMDGFEVMSQLRATIPTQDYLPILVLTAIVMPEAKRKALSVGANDFLTKPFDAVEVLLRIRNLLETRRLHLELQAHNTDLESLVKERTGELRQALTELRNAQRQLVQEERMRALSVMASGVAHDFNNALSVILGFGELVLRDCHREPTLARHAESMQAVVTAAQDAARMVSRLREFSHPIGSEVQQLVDLSALAGQAIRLTEPRWKTQARSNGISIEVVQDTREAAPILGDPAELREALTNLIFNAVDAMPSGGKITISTRTLGQSTILEVADTGTGMPEEVRQRCLEPFFTTKGEKGTGLGLAMVYGIVQRHSGELDIQSRNGEGSRFVFRFPSAQPEADGSTRAVARVDPLQILVVDDHEFIREIIAQFLAQDFHRVETAADGREAFELVQQRQYDLVITDQEMPEMPGSALVAAIKQRSPAQPVILLTGFGAEDEVAHSAGADLVLGKPLSREALRRAVAQTVVSKVRLNT